MWVPVDADYGRDCTGFNWYCGGPDIIRICLQLYKDVPIILIFCDVMSKVSENRHVLSVGLADGFWMVRRSDDVLSTEQGT